MNDQVNSGDLDLDGAVLVSLDVEPMYNNMTEQSGLGQVKIVWKVEMFRRVGT